MKLAKSLTALFLLPALAGCHTPLRSYRTTKSVVEVPPPSLGTSTGATPEVTINGPENRCPGTGAPICLAFIEIDDMGELWDKVEVDNALRVIRQANRNADPGKTDPIVIAFVHGWKNNAAEDNDNVKGFKLALQEVYRNFHATKRVIGIYIGWRGNLIKKAWPVSQQLSYYNREATATRVPGASLSSTLTQIAMRTHGNPRALAVFIGHSFGGLLLERAVSEATASQIAQAGISDDEAKNAASAEASDKQAIAKHAADQRADLVIFVNPAGAATEAKQMLDFLTANGYRYQPNLPPSEPGPSSDPDEDRPLFVSLTSTSDLATKVAMPIGHWWPDVKFKASGSFRKLGQNDVNKEYALECFDPHKDGGFYWGLKTKQDGAVDQSSYYMSTAPHMRILQSHDMLKAIGASQMQVVSTGQKITVSPDAIAQCDRNLFAKDLHIVNTFRLYDTQTCFAVQERPNRCNGTPYWLMEIDPDVVPDHSTIFTQRFIHFLIDTYFNPQGKPMQRLNPRLISGRPASE